MGVGKFLLKVILLPIALVVILGITGFLIYRLMRSKKEKETNIEAARIQPPAVSQWTSLQQQYLQQHYLQNQAQMHQHHYAQQSPTTTHDSHVQSPAPVAYKTPAYVEVIHTPA